MKTNVLQGSERQIERAGLKESEREKERERKRERGWHSSKCNN